MSVLAEGTLFARDYKVVRPLSAGGMGAVYVVEQLSTGKRRALKLMHPQLAASEEARTRFEREAKIGARIDSEHVVEVQAAGVDAASGSPYLVMELLDGEDLAASVERRGALPASEVAELFAQLGHALERAHAAGVIHRDLKPENLFLGRARRSGVAFTVKILDFGIAKLLEEGGTKSTNAIGTPMWLAPEQTERVPVTPAADVWALGLIAYYCLVGQSYWRAAASANGTVTQLLREILNDPLPAASARAAESGRTLPTGFDAWFARAVDRDPKARFADASAAIPALLETLGRAASHSPAAFAATELQPTNPPEAPAGSGAFRAIGALVALCVLGGIAWFALHRPSAPAPAAAPASASVSVSVSVSASASASASASVSAAASASVSAAASAPPARTASIKSDKPFDADAAVVALAQANIDTCGTIKASGMIDITFEPDGTVSAARFVGDNPVVGTKMGQCILERYQKVKVPPFAGDAVTKHKAFKTHEE